MSCASSAHSTRSAAPASTMRAASMTISRSHIARTTLRLWETSCGRKETAHAQLLREVLPQVKHHGLDRHVGDHEVGVEHNHAGDADARLLAPREPAREAIEHSMISGNPDASSRPFGDSSPCGAPLRSKPYASLSAAELAG